MSLVVKYSSLFSFEWKLSVRVVFLSYLWNSRIPSICFTIYFMSKFDSIDFFTTFRRFSLYFCKHSEYNSLKLCLLSVLNIIMDASSLWMSCFKVYSSTSSLLKYSEYFVNTNFPSPVTPTSSGLRLRIEGNCSTTAQNYRNSKIKSSWKGSEEIWRSSIKFLRELMFFSVLAR